MATAATAAVPAPAPATLTSTLQVVQEYRDYKGTMNIFTSKLDEILYLCDMVDIDKIDQFLINFLETYDFYKKNTEEEEGGYSDLNNYIDNIDEIINKTEYSNMTTYISKNYENIKKLFK